MIRMIAAYAHHRVIGMQGQVPWDMPEESRYFERSTLGQTVVMGRATFASLDKPLRDRRNIVLTSDPTFEAEGVEVVHDMSEVLHMEDIWIIGGEQIYRLFLPHADRLYVTEIDLEVEGDAFFPAWDPAEFHLRSSRVGEVNEQNPHPHTYLVYERNKS